MTTSSTSPRSCAITTERSLPGPAASPEGLLERLVAPAAQPFLRPRTVGGLPLLIGGLPGGVHVAFTTRHGGVSGGAHATLNLGLHTSDPQPAVAENRRRLAAALGEVAGGASVELVTPRQEHGLRVIGASEYRALAGGGPFSARPGCDGLTLRPAVDAGLAPLLLFADCVPVVLASEVDVAVVHAGWRGLLGGVIQQAARSMIAPPGLALIGPSIGPCCYQVSVELAEGFERRYGAGVAEEGSSGTGRRLDLWEVASRALEEVEVPRQRVTNPRLCTSCLPELFFSHRRDGPQTGRHAAVAWAGGQER